MLDSDKYKIIEKNLNFKIVKNEQTKMYSLYNCKNKSFDLENCKYIEFAYFSPLLTDELKNYKKDEVVQVILDEGNGRGIKSLRYEGGKLIKAFTPVPLKYENVHITTRGDCFDVENMEYNERCLVSVIRKGKRGVHIFRPNINIATGQKSILHCGVPCEFDDICEYYYSYNPYFKWWNERDENDLKYYYISKNGKYGVYDALEGKYAVYPKYSGVSPVSKIEGFRAFDGNQKCIIFEGEEYVCTGSLVSQMIQNNAELKGEHVQDNADEEIINHK